MNKLSFVIDQGEMRAIIGPNGAGKTTMMDIITGKTRPDEGEVFFEGDIDLTKRDEAEIANLGIGRKFQKPTVFESHTVLGQSGAGAQPPARDLPDAVLPPPGRGSAADRRDPGDRRLGDQRKAGRGLSHGQKQWLEIGMLLAQDPNSCWSTSRWPA